ncbi:Aste57867_1601 [Aphanomyces stellatus]|uniref:Aste57867_1601 protein n=1 Tax=Aphanomyces stellatus TaxID=120398 RepID=A0A485K5N5_9STRA|nr:hypothetical protein As57867_001600 [Aphanomyces stellatus]VFT78814.1 Aste57867_1601 [Aphanomyces stellatus]
MLSIRCRATQITEDELNDGNIIDDACLSVIDHNEPEIRRNEIMRRIMEELQAHPDEETKDDEAERDDLIEAYMIGVDLLDNLLPPIATDVFGVADDRGE